MPSSPRPSTSWPARLAVFVTCAALFALSRLPSAPADVVAALAARFRFTAFPLPVPPAPEGGVVFGVNPSAPQLKTYLHPMGGSVAFGDLDGDGLPNDLCYGDIRTKRLYITPVQGTGARYEPFELNFDLPVGREAVWPGVCKLGDMNEDGLLDVYVSMLGGRPQLFLRRDLGDAPDARALGPDAFVRQPLVAGPDVAWTSTCATFTDVDGDGHLDLVTCQYFKEGIALYDSKATRPLEMNESFTNARNGGPNKIFLWAGATSGPAPTVDYREVADPFPGDTEFAWTLAIGAGDIDKDGLSDLYVSNDFGPDTLLLNRSKPGAVQLIELKGVETFSSAESSVLGQDTYKGMGIDFGDLNDDGRLDMYVSNIATKLGMGESHFVWESTGDVAEVERGVAPYEDRAQALGVAHSAWAWDSRMDDFDNDGVLELVQATGLLKGNVNRWADLAQLGLANDNLVRDPRSWPGILPDTDVDGWKPNPFFARGPDGVYADLSAVLFPGVLPNSRGIATADVDGDGDLDMAWGNHWEESVYYRNDAPSPGSFLGLYLLLPNGAAPAGQVVHDGHPSWREGSPAVGAWVTVRAPDGRSQVRQVDGGNGHTGARSSDLHFGLGAVAADADLDVEIRWRDRSGALHTDPLRLKPGWHTVVLGDPNLPPPAAAEPVSPEVAPASGGAP